MSDPDKVARLVHPVVIELPAPLKIAALDSPRVSDSHADREENRLPFKAPLSLTRVGVDARIQLYGTLFHTILSGVLNR